MATRPALVLAWLGLACAPAGAAQDTPLSAIDWLSDTIETAPQAPPAATAPAATTPDDIDVLPLDAPVSDGAGLKDAEELGLDPGLWGRSSAGDLSRALERVQINASSAPSLLNFYLDLIGARFDPPIDAVIDQDFFLARIDRLLGLGHLDDAAALIEAAGVTNEENFRRQFDIALLQGSETEMCRLIEQTPDLSPTYPARIFCLARLGQWDIAALTLGNAETLGILSEREDKLLLHFLDPELFEGEPLPPAPRLPSPLLFRLFEAVGERISTSGLPVAFAVADFGTTVGWKTRLRAAERLAATGALEMDALLDVYQEREPAASGAEWNRVAALQALAKALQDGSEPVIEKALPDAWNAAKEADFEHPFANWVAQILPKNFDAARSLTFEIALFAENPTLAARFASGSEQDQFLLALAQGTPPPPGHDPLTRAVLRGLSAINPGPEYQALIDDDRKGEALFRALAQLNEGAAGNPNATANSLAFLRTLGLDGLARQIAVELILMESTA